MVEGLREATLSLVETGVSAISSDVFEYVYIYQNGKILDEVYTKNGIFLYLRLHPFMPRKNQKVNWVSSKRLIFGSLVILTNPDFKEFVFAVVQTQNWKKNEKKFNKEYIDVFIKGIGSDHLNLLELCSKLDVNNLVVLECKGHFESYYHFLTALKNIHPNDLPFKSQIIDMEFANPPPAYLKNSYFNITNRSLKQIKNNLMSFNMANPPKDSEIQNLLDESQFKALQNILTHEISVIQGPPGTGKRF